MLIDSFAPASPSEFTLASPSGAPLLHWSNGWSESIDGFRIERQIDDGDWNLVGFALDSAREFKDLDRLYSSTVRYRVVAVTRTASRSLLRLVR